jgi:hypothetical protein
MPSFTPKALAVELADTRAAAIQECAALLGNLTGVSPAVAAGALAGLAQDAIRELDEAKAAAAAELAARPPKATPTGVEQPELG